MAQGMFDWNYVDPRMIQDAYVQSRQVDPKTMAQLPLLNQVAAMGGNTGAALGAGLGRLFGGQAPMQAENELMKNIFSSAAQATSDPIERMKLAAQGLRNSGLEGRAQQLEQQMAQMLSKGVDPTSKLIEGAKYTPASIAKYRKTGNVEDLVLVEKDKPLNYGTDAEIVSKAMFGKPFEALTAPEADAVRKEMERVGVTRAKAGATNVSQVVTNKAT